MIAVVEDAPVGTPATRQRIEALEQQVRERPDVASVTGFYDTRSKAFVSNDGLSTYFAVALKATEDKPWQDAGREIADELNQEPGVLVGGAAVAQEQVNKQVEEDLKKAELIAFPGGETGDPIPTGCPASTRMRNVSGLTGGESRRAGA